MFASPGEVAFSIADFDIYYYGLIISMAVFSGFALSYFIAKKYYPEVNTDCLYDVVTVAMIGGFIFARLYYCILNFNYYSENPIEILFLRQGGISIQGGILGGLIFGGIYAYFKNLPFLKLADILAYGIILAQAIGRWGNFFNSEAFGLPNEGFLSLTIPIEHRPLAYKSFEHFHPTFLYESLADILILIILFVLFFIVGKFIKIKQGTIFASYLILYSIIRFFIEGLRIDSVLMVHNIPIAQIVCVVVILITTIFLIIHSKMD